MEEPMESPPEYDRIRAAVHSVEAPAALRERISAERDRTLIKRMVVRRMKLTGVLAGGAAVLGASLALLAPSGGGTDAPSALDAAALATRGAVAAAPRVNPVQPHLLRVSVGGVPFPRWQERFPWKPTGQRVDELAGRSTMTVFYDDPRGVRLGYTIVDGEALPWPAGARTVVRNGVEVHLLRRAGRIMAFWRAHGRSCIISAPDSVPAERMVALASAEDYVA
jgi:hypothetical protein